MRTIIGHVHGRAREHVAGPHQHGIAGALGKPFGLLQRGELRPRRLVDAQLVEQGRELVAVLGAVDGERRGAQHGDALGVQGQGQVVGRLAAHGEDHPGRPLDLVDVAHALERELFEVELVADVVIRGDRLRVVVDHDDRVAARA